jgi:hypothetical protein
MANLYLEIDDDLLVKLKKSAVRNGCSIQQQVENSLRSLFPKQTLSREALFKEAQRIAAMTPKGVKQTDSVKILRAHRDGTAIED